MPPKLDGGVKLIAEPLDERHVRLRLEHDNHRAELVAAPLAVPYPSGLDRLVAADRQLQAVLVERIPPGLEQAAEKRGIAILDVHGKGRIVAPGFVYVSSSARPDAGSRPDLLVPHSLRSSPFAPKASRVVRLLLAKPGQPKRLSEIAETADMNPGNVHRALAALQALALVERHEDQYEVLDPGSLLEAWADASRRPRERFSISLGEGAAADLVRDLLGSPGGGGSLGERAAVSGEVAAELLVPHLAARSAVVHVWDADAYHKAARDWRSPNIPFSRAIVQVELADDKIAQFGSERGGLKLVSPAQLYVDLYRSRGRARDAAEEMRRQVLGY